MADEDLAIAPAALETPASEPTQEPEERPVDIPTEDAAPSPDDNADPEGQDAADDEFETIEDDGKQYQIPKALKGKFLMNADYTQKTQAVSARQQALDTREAQITQQAEATDAELNDRATLRSIDAQLAEFAKLTPADWQYHDNQDPMGTRQAERQYQFLKDQKAEIASRLSNVQTERTVKAEQDLANRVQETLKFAAKEIPGWKPELTDQLVKFALDEGVPEDVLKKNWSPQLYKLLHKAQFGDLAMKKPATVAKPTTPVTPLVTVTGKSTPAARQSIQDIANGDDMEAYAAARKAGRVR